MCIDAGGPIVGGEPLVRFRELDVLLAAANAGLTVIQAELLAYLQMGLTNQEIADATNVGVPTVRYRLTRLYRALGVSGRKAAIAAARELGLSASLSDA